MLLPNGQIWKFTGSRKIHLKLTNIKGNTVLKVIVNRDAMQYAPRGRLARKRRSLTQGLSQC